MTLTRMRTEEGVLMEVGATFPGTVVCTHAHRNKCLPVSTAARQFLQCNPHFLRGFWVPRAELRP